jgi:hypothetical protein
MVKKANKNNRQEVQFDPFLPKEMQDIWWKVEGTYENEFCRRADKTHKEFQSYKS